MEFLPEKAERVISLLDEEGIKPESIIETEIISVPLELIKYLKKDPFWRVFLFERMGVTDEEEIDCRFERGSWKSIFRLAGIFIEGWRPPPTEDLEKIKDVLKRREEGK